MARLRHAGHEDSVLDEVSPPLRGLASDFGKTQSHQRSNPPIVRPPASGSLGSPVCPTARADGPSLAQRRSLGVLPRGLDKRSHLGEQQGARPSPQHRSQLTAPVIYSEQRSGGLLSLIWPLAHPMARADCRSYATGVIDMVAQGENNCEYNSKLHTSLSGNGFILKARQ